MHQIILITIDTLRADHLGLHGYPRKVSPNLDELSQGSVTFDWAFSPISYTGPAHFSIMTSQFPSFHCVQFHNGGLPTLQGSEETLAEILSRQGYATAAFISASVLAIRNLRPMGKGFQIYDEEMTHHESNRDMEYRRWAAETTAAAVAWIDANRNDPFFCWIHYMDVHGPYQTSAPFNNLFANEVARSQPRNLQVVPDGYPGGIPAYQLLKVLRDQDGNLIDYERNYHHYLACYDGGIRYVDSCISMLIHRLKTWDLYNDLLLVVTSDHGEALGENDVFFFHSLTVSIDQVHVPLIIKVPRSTGTPAQRITNQVSTIDIAPTILDLLGIDGLAAQGISLLPLIEGTSLERYADRVIFSEIETQVAAANAQHQLLLGRGLPEQQQFPFFHPDAPSGKMIFDYRDGSKAPQFLPAADSLERIGIAFHQLGRESVASHQTISAEGKDNEGVLEHLKALGYVG